MAPDLLNWDNDLESETADYVGEIIKGELNKVSERNDERSRTTLKDKFSLCIVADKNYLKDIQIIPPTSQVSAISIFPGKSHIFTKQKEKLY